MSRSRSVKSILVAYNGFVHKERLPAQVVSLAKEHGARLHIVNVVPEVPDPAWRSRMASAEELQGALIEERHRALEKLAERARAQGIGAETRTRVGIAHVELIREAMATKSDLLVATDDPLRRDRGPGFGSTTMKLLRKCPCPVWVIRSPAKRKRRRIMAAVDLGPRRTEASLPNHRIIELATLFARDKGSTLYVFHAWSLWGERVLRGRGGVHEAEVEELLVQAKQTQASHLDKLLGTHALDGIDVRILLEKGQPRVLLPAAVEKHKIDVLVMGTVSRTGLPGVLIGNTAEKILNQLSCSVVTVKPKGFVSPIVQAKSERSNTKSKAPPRRSRRN